MNGILLIDKPIGWTSFDCVAKARSIVRAIEGKKVKVGHAGTLDPLASGLMIVLVGSFTKKAELLTKKDKIYEVRLKLGVKSTTGDEEGTKSIISDSIPGSDDLARAIDKFIGDIEQTPPIHSAIKVNGVRSYKLAREGRATELKSRPVKINSISLNEYSYPSISLTADVSSGTYIRSLVEDIGDSLGVGAYTTAIRRTSIDNFKIEDSIEMEALNVDNIEQRLIVDFDTAE